MLSLMQVPVNMRYVAMRVIKKTIHITNPITKGMVYTKATKHVSDTTTKAQPREPNTIQHWQADVQNITQ